MAMFDDIFAGNKGVASTLLGTMGITGTYTKTTSTYDPRTDTTSKITTENIVKVSPPLSYNAYEIATYGIKKEDCKFIGLGTDFSSIDDELDTLTVNGAVYVIISHKDIWSGNQLAAVSMQCRLQA